MRTRKKHELQDLLILFSHTLLEVNTDAKILQSVIFNSDYHFAKTFYDNLKNMKQYKVRKPFIIDGPDIIWEAKDSIYGIEMFEFDASKKLSHKGSSFRTNEDQIFRNANKSAQKHYEEPLKANFSLEDYRKNIIGIFNNHYNNIDYYKDNLIHKNIEAKEIKICFVIVDRTPGNLIVKVNDNRKTFYTPLLDECFVNNLNKKDKLDYLITFHCENYIQCPIFVSISKDHIDELEKRCVKNLTHNKVISPIITKIVETF